MYDYEQIEDSLRFCDRKIYLSHIDDHNTKKYSESEKKKWEDIANDILKEKNTQNRPAFSRRYTRLGYVHNREDETVNTLRRGEQRKNDYL